MYLTKSITFSVALGLSHAMSSLQAQNSSSETPSNSTGNNHIVNVAKDGLTFEPPNVKAQKGDTITFVFFQGGHSVTQTHFDNPCSGTKSASTPLCQLPPPLLSTSVPTETSAQSSYPTIATPTDVSATNVTGGTQPALPSVDTPPPVSSVSDYPTSSSNTSAPPSIDIPSSPDVPTETSPTSFPSEGLGTPPIIPANATPAVNCTSGGTPNITSSEQPPPTDPVVAPPAANEGIVSSVSSGMGTGMDTQPPQVCDAKCIEVTGACQMSADCTLQQQSPVTTKCKIEDGVCKICGQNTNANSSQNPDSNANADTTSSDETALTPPAEVNSGNAPPQDGSVNHWRQKRSSELHPISRRQAQIDGASMFPQETPNDPNNNAIAAPVNPTLSDQTAANPTDPSTPSTTNYTDPSTLSQDGPGLDSGLVKVDDASKSTGIQWKITITDDSKPLWFMSAGQNDCTSGMVFAVNAPESGHTASEFASIAKTSTCASPYPSCTKLSGDGATASSPPPKCAASAPPPDQNGTITSGSPPTDPTVPLTPSSNDTAPPSSNDTAPPSSNDTAPPSNNDTAPPTVVSATGTNPPPATPPAQTYPPVANASSGGDSTGEQSSNGTSSSTKHFEGVFGMEMDP
ncbi:uncharacterized protein MELLADRAFT_87968 [Melampsora larici-populina 98AG31]|uniref:Secreted protein n=1 Tax=Melampsora larici-populina (strain 98AG31 / pathotype 3-4-7) TaxID=747676 RepID=F4RQK3_MELLP|nr:uncharacterized protein MELLADRAFT_87968 [Melampsora larici-populina 98AG31]EGG05314.1 hypothetical protein MELLADRAFT_87968 [Melampsora larici-populina 98AG31]